jgi:anti-anti-sigma factor
VLAGRVGRDSAPVLAAAINAALARPHPLIVIDFEHVDYISSAGLRVIDDAATRSANQSGVIVLASVCEPVRVALDLGGVLARVAVEAAVTDAIARAKQQG